MKRRPIDREIEREGHKVLGLLHRFRKEGADAIGFGALLDDDDERTLGEAVDRYFELHARAFVER